MEAYIIAILVLAVVVLGGLVIHYRRKLKKTEEDLENKTFRLSEHIQSE